MTNTLDATQDAEYAERWQQWQRRYARSNRRSGRQARIAFTLLLIAAAVVLALQLQLSPVWS